LSVVSGKRDRNNNCVSLGRSVLQDEVDPTRCSVHSPNDKRRVCAFIDFEDVPSDLVPVRTATEHEGRECQIEPVPSRHLPEGQAVEGKDNGRNLKDFLVSAEKRTL
jgi:hypothetical protein